MEKEESSLGALTGTRTLAICETTGMDRHMELLAEYLNEPSRLHQLRETKLKDIAAYQRGEWQMASDDLEVEKARLFLMINETPSDGGRGAAAAEVLRKANAELAQANEQLEVERSRLILAVNDEVDDKGKAKYGSADLRNARLLVLLSKDPDFQAAVTVVRAAEDAASQAKTAADAQAPKPKYSNEAARNAAMVQLQQTDFEYKAALGRFRKADQHISDLKAEADDLQQQIANVSGKLWGLREMVKGDAAVLMAVSSLDGPKLPSEIRITGPETLPSVVILAPDTMPGVQLKAPESMPVVTVNVARGAA